MPMISLCTRFLAALLLVFLCLPVPANGNSQKPYAKWLDEDVRWIVTDRERAEFLKLSSDDDRDKFIESFWSRRNPNPGAQENVFKEEHYRRIAYSNIHFASGVPGWRTDRGRVYIVYGPPDEIESHPPAAQTGKNAPLVYPSEIWRYHHLKGSSHDLTVPFVDTCQCGEYRLGIDLFKEH